MIFPKVSISRTDWKFKKKINKRRRKGKGRRDRGRDNKEVYKQEAVLKEQARVTAHGYLILFPSMLSVFPGFPTVSSPFFPWVDTLQTQIVFPKA